MLINFSSVNILNFACCSIVLMTLSFSHLPCKTEVKNTCTGTSLNNCDNYLR